MIGGLFVLFAYVLGSLPTGLWIAKKVKGKDFDIRDWGSGNIGATNVLRVLGWKISLPVFVADTFKGWLPVFLVLLLTKNEGWGITCLVAAVFGHAFSFVMFIREGGFSGGKSVATAFGGVIALQPAIAVIALAVFLLVLGTTRYLSFGSISGAITAFVMTLVFHQGLFWSGMLFLLALFILYTHRRNLGNLLSGTEHKFGQSFAVHGEKEGVRTAFVIHSISEDDLQQSPLSGWILKLRKRGTISARTLRWLVAHSPVIKVDEITGIVDSDGKPATVVILGIPMLADQIMDPANKELVESLLKAAAIQSQRMGATVIGLGALLSSAAKGGWELQRWAKEERQLRITVDNGGAFTATATLEALRQVKSNIGQATIAIVGASGVIGYAISKYLANRKQQFGQMMLFARAKSKIEDFAGLAEILASNELEELSRADVVIFATSSPTPLVTGGNANIFKSGTVVMDIAVPADVADEVSDARPDTTLIRCGLIQLPGYAQSRVDFHFGTINLDDKVHQLFPACLAQGLLMGYTGDYSKASQGIRIEPAVIDWYTEAARRHGFKVIASAVDERGIFSGRMAYES